MHISTNLLGSVVFMVSLTGVTGCKQHLDRSKVEGLVKSAAEEQKASVKSVTCPDNREIKAGDKFECDGQLADGSKFKANIEQKDDQGTIHAAIPGRFVDLKKVASDMKGSIGASDIKCAEKVILIRKGDAFSCDATVNGAAAKVSFTVTDDEGNVDYKVVGGGAAPAASAAEAAGSAAPAASAAPSAAPDEE